MFLKKDFRYGDTPVLFCFRSEDFEYHNITSFKEAKKQLPYYIKCQCDICIQIDKNLNLNILT